ncbi:MULTISPECIES: LysM peptidoglycan-binding domain-containing protein [Prevotellaceae]|uniref:LysM peptidoglycan-binding domain-containing protein n=1 Tax=Leyella stercorea TaxID=363265 RepID=UPI001F3A3C53|nr:LysM domain-containing protein [Leyella stercorea]MCF2580126.1 LysM peptidoglycan-binding domain-containing protein [Leyella stercorea]
MIKKMILSVLLCTVCVFTMAQSQTVTHVVQRGETIESIAEYYKVSVEDINKANPNADGIVYVGMKLNIPTSSKPQIVSNNDNQGGSTYTQENNIKHHSNNKVYQEHKYKAAKNEDEKVGKFEFAGELGFGFIKGADNFMYEATVGANYRLPYNLYIGARIGYNSANYTGLIKIEGQNINAKQNYHLLEIPIEFGYSLKNESETLGLIPFVGFNTNIGLSGKYKQRILGTGGKEEPQKVKIGGKVGIGARVGVRVCLWGFDITGSYQIPLNDKQKGWFGKDAFPEITLAWGF